LLCKPPEPQPRPPEPPKPAVAERKPPPAKPPDLPEDRWKKGDLALLKGCWRLGRDAQTNLRLPGGQVLAGHDRAGRICFDDNGHGTREKSSEFPGQPTIKCRAPVTASFQGDIRNKDLKSSKSCFNLVRARYYFHETILAAIVSVGSGFHTRGCIGCVNLRPNQHRSGWVGNNARKLSRSLRQGSWSMTRPAAIPWTCSSA
jgi:hypothetical protein